MKVLLTINEYRERAINVIMETAKENINPNGNDYFKFQFIYHLAKETFDNQFMCVDVVNQLFIKTFRYDRNGKMLCLKNVKQINTKEADEFNSQEWYVDYNEKRKKSWQPQQKIVCESHITKDQLRSDIFDIERIVSLPFVEDINMPYHIANECFKRLYGYDFEIDKGFILS